MDRKYKFLAIFVPLTILTSGLLIVKTLLAPKITKVYPKPNTQNAHTDTDFFLEIVKSPFPIQPNCTLSSNPSLQFTLKQSDNKYTFSPTTKLAPSTPYVLTASCSNSKPYQWTVTTSSITPQEQQTQLNQQASADMEIAATMADFYQQYPFAKLLPIKTPDYLIIYSSVNNEIIIATTEEFPNIEAAKTTIGADIEQKLNIIKAPSDISVRWVVNERN